jgi:hypothetical protein
MQREALDQATLAEAAGVSQPTVSRALMGGERVRRGRAYRRLLSFVAARTKMNRSSTAGTKRVTSAFEKIWDGSDVHAAAIAQIIEDLAGLTPSPALRKRGVQKRT